MRDMASMKDMAPALASRFSDLAQRHRAKRADRIAEGQSRWGWPPDPACDQCGDTGRWPSSIHFCGCAAGREREAQEIRDRQRDEAWAAAGVPPRFAAYRLSSAPSRAAADRVTAWIEAGHWRRGANLLLSGPVGTGKSGLAVGAVAALIDEGCTSLRFVGVPELLDRLRPGGSADVTDHVKGAAILVLDDLGAEKATEWARERLYVLLNARYEGMQPTIATTNCDLGTLAAALRERTVSRFAEQLTMVSVDGPDLRRGGHGADHG